MAFMNMCDITKVIITMDAQTLRSIDVLLDSFANGDFFSKMNKALDVCKNKDMKDLIVRISNCYMSYEYKDSKDFITMLKNVVSCFRKPSSDKLNEFLLAISFFDDEKLRYDTLKALSQVSVKDKNIKNQIRLDILKTKYATVSDYNVVVSAWANNQIELQDKNLQSLINNWLAAFVAYVSIKQPVDSFNYVMHQVNKTVNEVAVKSPDIADNIRVSYAIRPQNVYIQQDYINRFSGTNLIETAQLQKNVSMAREKNTYLKQTNSELRSNLESSDKLNKMLQETLSEKNQEIKALEKYIETLQAQLRRHGVFVPARQI